MQGINNCVKKEEDVGTRKKNSLIKSKTTSIDSRAKWRLKSKCNLKRESKSVITFKKCWSKMRLTKEDKKKKKIDRDLKI